MKLLVDMNVSPRWVKLLHDAGFETSHWSDLGPATASDAEIMRLLGLRKLYGAQAQILRLGL